MEIFSILDLEDVKEKEAPRDVFFEDLNLSQIIEEVSKVWGSDILNFYRYFPGNRECEEYRRAVMKDLLTPGVYEILLEAVNLMEKCKEANIHGERARQNITKSVWLINEVAFFSEALLCTYKGISSVEFSSEGMSTFKGMLKAFVESERFKKYSETAFSVRDSLNAARVTLTYDNSRIVLSTEKNDDDPESNLSEVLKRLRPGFSNAIKSPFSDSEELVGMEYELVSLFMKKNPDIYKTLGEFYREFKEYGPGWIFRFYKEITFYLSFIKFSRHIKELGGDMSVPTEDETANISAEGLYDLALLIANHKRGKTVVSNDFEYLQREQFFVLTGPNQGGKTTFARSLGQLVFFTKMGLLVPAKKANLHYFSTILTHFSVEESVETGRGKLMEELVRLSPMMEVSRENSFVIINELFTTAANYDAVIMGKRVLEHFIGMGSHGIYVTHLAELIDFEDKATGLCAVLDDFGKQTFKIEKRIMEYENCAEDRIEKYGLSYEKLKERLSERKSSL